MLNAILTPLNQNVFYCRLGPLSFDCFSMLAVDLMHKMELGIWKSLFIHLLHILELHERDSENLVVELDRR